jgi:ribosomal protein L7/L12
MATIDDLVRLVPPPEAPVDAIGDWERVETDLALKLPSDFKMLIQRYGFGQFASFIILLSPFGPHAMLFYEARRLQEDNRPFLETHPDLRSYAFYPEPGGLLPWARTDNGERLCWLTEGRPDTWTTVIWNPRAWDFEAHAVGAVAFLHGWLTGQTCKRIFSYDPLGLWFDPYQERRQVDLKLSEGELPYSEGLRILREAVAPTADRDGFQDADGRQDNFVATALGWRLTYVNGAYGHEILVGFPPEDEDRARRTMLDAAARMGCRVLTAISRRSGEPVWGYPTLREITQPITQPKEKGEFTVVLETAGGTKLEVIKAIRALWGSRSGLKEAKELVESAPKNVVEGVARTEAEKIKATLEKVGAKVRLERP